MSFFLRYLPVISFMVGSLALYFQIFIVYPWHNDLESEFKKLKEQKEQQDHKLEDYNSRKMDKIYELQNKINYLITVEEEKIKKFKRNQ